MVKTCYKCSLNKETSVFSKDSRSKDGLQSKCKECDRSYRKEKAVEIKAYKAVWSKQDAPKLQRQAYKKLNSGKCNANKAKRKAAKSQRTPKWLSQEALNQIEEFYVAAKEASWLSEDPLEVDHIVPLQGKEVCGLHVPWNLQILPSIDNAKKRNKFQYLNGYF